MYLVQTYNAIIEGTPDSSDILSLFSLDLDMTFFASDIVALEVDRAGNAHAAVVMGLGGEKRIEFISALVKSNQRDSREWSIALKYYEHPVLMSETLPSVELVEKAKAHGLPIKLCPTWLRAVQHKHTVADAAASKHKKVRVSWPIDA